MVAEADDGRSDSVTFFLNGRSVRLVNPDPSTLLIDYLRSPDVGLAGPKKPCGQGGCGGCTVMVSRWNERLGRPDHTAVNACLRPLVSLQGLAVTTVEGTGSARRPNPRALGVSAAFSRAAPPLDAALPSMDAAQQESAEKRRRVLEEASQAQGRVSGDLAVRLRSDIPEAPSEFSQYGINPVAWRLAINNGTQCGYCTVGFVMNMSEFLVNNPGATKLQIEAALDGNLCRCTGYRAIITGLQTFASDWTAEDEEARMKCLADAEAEAQKPTGELVIPFPQDARAPARGADVSLGDRMWLSPTSLADLIALMRAHPGARLVAGNTSYGVYKAEARLARVQIATASVPELHRDAVVGPDVVEVPAAATYSELIALLEQVMTSRGELEPGPDGRPIPVATTRLGAVHFMAQRSAGRIVRNAATVGGNLMMMLHHIHKDEPTPGDIAAALVASEPFPSDIATALVAVGAEVDVVDAGAATGAAVATRSFEALVADCIATPGLAGRLVLVRLRLPCGGPGDVLLPQKVALREVNAHSIVNHCCRLTVAGGVVTEASLVFGGIAPHPWRAAHTEAALLGQPLDLGRVGGLSSILEGEVQAELRTWASRMAGLPTEGFTDAYRATLALAALYKDVVHALEAGGGPVPGRDRSAGSITWGRWPASVGHQSYTVQLSQEGQPWKAPVSQPYIKIAAMEQASGQIHYTHELPVPPRTIQSSLVLSRRALATWHFCLPGGTPEIGAAELRKHLAQTFPAFIDLITAQDVPVPKSNKQGMGGDQPVFSEGRVDYAGQVIALLGATSEVEAQAIADYVTDNCVAYEPIRTDPEAPAWWGRAVLTLEDAIAVGSIYPDWPQTVEWPCHIWRVTRPGSRLDWAAYDREPLDQSLMSTACKVDNAPCLVVGGTQTVGGQAHFYMEPQAVVVEPLDRRRFLVRPSSQSPMEMHQTVAQVLGVQLNAVEVQVPPLGGGFGGKTEQARFVTAAAAIASYATKRPVRLTLTREQDMAMIGKRHAYYGQYQIAVDTGETCPEDKGLIRGLLNRLWGDGGAFYDCSFIVSNCIQARSDNAYRIANFESQIDVCRTNTAPSTAFRAFGDVQSKIILESGIDDAAFAIGMRAEEVREKNLYVRGDVTPFGQALSGCYLKEVWAHLKEKSNFDARVAEVESFNAANRWRKRGIAMMPLKYGSGYNLASLEQAGATVSVYEGDGTIVIHQGGVEMGQGLITQVRQIASYVLDLPMDMIEVLAPRTSVIPNPSSTGGSTGTAYNGEAVKRLCSRLRERLMGFAHDMLVENGPDWCASQGIDYWKNVDVGWKAEFENRDKTISLKWQKLVKLAYAKRQSLIETLTAPITGGETPSPVLTYKPFAEQPVIPGYKSVSGQTPGEFDNFIGFTYSGACAVVEVDILTGETKLLSADLVYDMGWSLNPAIDIGQVEGAFLQGVGYVLSERLVFEPDGEEAGRLNTSNTWTYKPPASTSVPLVLNTHLFPRDEAKVPSGVSDGVLSSKEVGEPPLVLATSVFLAVKAAVRASRLERGLSGLFRLDAPATVQEVSQACAVEAEHLVS